MSKFQVGDRVFHIGLGAGKVTEIDPTIVHGEDAVDVRFDADPNLVFDFALDGRYCREHTIPQLYTAEEARKMGFDVPKEKIKKSKTLWLYHSTSSGSTYVCEESEPSQIGFLEKKVTFEWEVEE